MVNKRAFRQYLTRSFGSVLFSLDPAKAIGDTVHMCVYTDP